MFIYTYIAFLYPTIVPAPHSSSTADLGTVDASLRKVHETAIIWATTNAVNVTDGLDGLAAGSALMGFGAFALIGYWLFRNPDVYDGAVNPLDMGVFAAAFAGGCLGFLWWIPVSKCVRAEQFLLLPGLPEALSIFFNNGFDGFDDLLSLEWI